MRASEGTNNCNHFSIYFLVAENYINMKSCGNKNNSFCFMYNCISIDSFYNLVLSPSTNYE